MYLEPNFGLRLSLSGSFGLGSKFWLSEITSLFG